MDENRFVSIYKPLKIKDHLFSRNGNIRVSLGSFGAKGAPIPVTTARRTVGENGSWCKIVSQG
jgi:hypothetical protein